MKKINVNIFTIAIILIFSRVEAQTVSTFENITLATDTFWNGSDWSGGFTSGNAIFVNHYDTAFGFSSWDGFAVSNKRDTLTSGYTNQYSSVTGSGYQSTNYAVGYYSSYSPSPMRIKLNGAAKGKLLSGFYITNSTYSYLAMRDGSALNKKFGGTTGNDPDWFKLTVSGYKNGGQSTDSIVEFYLADFRFADNSKDYFIKEWTWLDLSKLGNVDSIEFAMSSNDTAGGFGMRNPSYFCMDNFTTLDVHTGIDDIKTSYELVSIYPNPAKNFIAIDGINDNAICSIIDLTGKEIFRTEISNSKKVDTENWSKGIYFMRIISPTSVQTKKLIIE